MERQENSWKEKIVILHNNWHKEIKESINNYSSNFMSFDKRFELIRKIQKLENLNNHLEEAKKREVKENVWKSIYKNFSNYPSNQVYMLSEKEAEKWKVMA